MFPLNTQHAWSQTFTGKRFNVFDPKESDVILEDIAHHLSNICRFGGACRKFYSVAEHAVLASHIVPFGCELDALHHDDPEAYLGDLIRPLKLSSTLGEVYKTIEADVWGVIACKFQLPEVLPKAVHLADNRMLALEKRELMLDIGDSWEALANVKPADIPLWCWSPEQAEGAFLARHEDILRKRFFHG